MWHTHHSLQPVNTSEWAHGQPVHTSANVLLMMLLILLLFLVVIAMGR